MSHTIKSWALNYLKPGSLFQESLKSSQHSEAENQLCSLQLNVKKKKPMSIK